MNMREENPFARTPLSVHCGYCGAQAGKYCHVKGSPGVQAVEIHDFRYAQRQSAVKAWEEGRKHGRQEVVDAVLPGLEAFQEKVASEQKAG